MFWEFHFMILLMFLVIAKLGFILNLLWKIERKTDDHNDRPKNQRFWGNGKKR